MSLRLQFRGKETIPWMLAHLELLVGKAYAHRDSGRVMFMSCQTLSYTMNVDLKIVVRRLHRYCAIGNDAANVVVMGGRSCVTNCQLLFGHLHNTQYLSPQGLC